MVNKILFNGCLLTQVRTGEMTVVLTDEKCLDFLSYICLVGGIFLKMNGPVFVKTVFIGSMPKSAQRIYYIIGINQLKKDSWFTKEHIYNYITAPSFYSTQFEMEN